MYSTPGSDGGVDETLQEQRDPVLSQHVSDELSGRSSKDSRMDHRWPPVRQLLHRQRHHNLVSNKEQSSDLTWNSRGEITHHCFLRRESTNNGCLKLFLHYS